MRRRASGRNPLYRVSKEAYAPRGGFYETQENAHGGGLAGAVRPQKRKDLTTGYLERQVVDGPNGAILLGQTLGFNDPIRFTVDDASPPCQ